MYGLLPCGLLPCAGARASMVCLQSCLHTSQECDHVFVPGLHAISKIGVKLCVSVRFRDRMFFSQLLLCRHPWERDAFRWGPRNGLSHLLMHFVTTEAHKIAKIAVSNALSCPFCSSPSLLPHLLPFEQTEGTPLKSEPLAAMPHSSSHGGKSFVEDTTITNETRNKPTPSGFKSKGSALRWRKGFAGRRRCHGERGLRHNAWGSLLSRKGCGQHTCLSSELPSHLSSTVSECDPVFDVVCSLALSIILSQILSSFSLDLCPELTCVFF